MHICMYNANMCTCVRVLVLLASLVRLMLAGVGWVLAASFPSGGVVRFFSGIM